MPLYKFRKAIKHIAEPQSMMVFCTICNGKFVPEAGGDPICPDCFLDIHQPNQEWKKALSKLLDDHQTNNPKL